MKTKLKSVQKYWIKFFATLLAVGVCGFCGGMAYKSFFEPLAIIPTGISGFSALIKTWLSAGGIEIPTSVVFLILNVFIFALAFRYMGLRFLALSGMGMGTFTLAMQFGEITAITNLATTDNTFLFVFVGAIAMGVAIGIAMRLGGSTGGSDILGLLINRKFPKIKVGYCVLMINIVVIALSILTSGIQTGLYAIVICIINALTTNMMIDKTKRIVSFHIICDKAEEISEEIFKHYHRGVTKINAQGMYTKNQKSVLLCLAPYDQSYKMREFILKIDPNAFVFSSPVTETIGEADFFQKRARYGNHRITKSGLKQNKKFAQHKQIKKLKLNKQLKKYKIKKN